MTPPDVAPATAPGPSLGASTAATTAMTTAGADIRDIRGPKYIFPIWMLPALLAAALLLTIGGYVSWRWWKRRRRPRAPLPFEIALQRLEALRSQMQPANARQFSIDVSDIVRNYIEQRFDATAAHRTTEEFLHDLVQSSNTALARHRELLAEFLQQCDLVKFAGLSLSVDAMQSLHSSARAFVQQTAVPEAAIPTAPSASGAPTAPAAPHATA